MTVSIYKDLIARDDMKLWDGDTSNRTFDRKTSTGGTVSLTKFGSGTYYFDDLRVKTFASGEAAGDILYYNGSLWVVLAKGTARQVLQTNSGATAPEWAPSPQSVMTAQGDILYAGAANTLARLAPSTAGYVFQTGGAAANPSYVAPWQIRDLARNLVIVNTSGHTDHQMDVDADEIILQNTDGVPKRVASVNLTIDIDAAAGVNALDTGAVAATTWYYIWVIDNGSTTAGLFSLSSTAPTMPSGYTFKALVGAIYTGSGPANDFITIYQKDHWVNGPRVAAVSNGGGATYTEIDLAAIIPATAKRARGVYGSVGASGTLYIAPVGSGTTGYGDYQFTGVVSSFEVSVYTAQKLYYYIVTSNANIFITGWEY